MNHRVVALVVVAAAIASACTSSSPTPVVAPTSTTVPALAPPTSASVPVPADLESDQPLLSKATTTPTQCPAGLGDPTVSCGLADVLLDPSDPTGPTIEVSFVVVAGSDGGFDTPVAVMQGGPGGASSEMAVWFPQREFTQVFIDQRGTGFASPDLDCGEAENLAVDLIEMSSTEALIVAEDAYASCAARLAGSPLLAHTNTAAHAADVESVMAGLGHGRWVAYGVSYGTTIALQLMRIEAVGLIGTVLDGVYPAELDVDRALAFSAARSIDAVATACRDDISCRGIVDGVADTLDRLIVELDSDPMVVSVGDGIPEAVLDGQRLAEFTFLMLYSDREIARVPWVLEGLERRDAQIARWLIRLGATIGSISAAANDEGTYLAVQCHDRAPFTDGPPAEMGPFASAMTAFSTAEICEPWSVGSAPEVDGSHVESDLPSLLLSGGFDPITPAEYATAAAEHLTRSTTVEQAGRGHGIWFGNDCIADIVLSFVSDPTRVLDVSCASLPVPVDWVEP